MAFIVARSVSGGNVLFKATGLVITVQTQRPIDKARAAKDRSFVENKKKSWLSASPVRDTCSISLAFLFRLKTCHAATGGKEICFSFFDLSNEDNTCPSSCRLGRKMQTTLKGVRESRGQSTLMQIGTKDSFFKSSRNEWNLCVAKGQTGASCLSMNHGRHQRVTPVWPSCARWPLFPEFLFHWPPTHLHFDDTALCSYLSFHSSRLVVLINEKS